MSDMDELIDLRHLRDENAQAIARLEGERDEALAIVENVQAVIELWELEYHKAMNGRDAARADAARMREAITSAVFDSGVGHLQDATQKVLAGAFEAADDSQAWLDAQRIAAYNEGHEAGTMRRIEEADAPFREALKLAGIDIAYSDAGWYLIETALADAGTDGGQS